MKKNQFFNLLMSFSAKEKGHFSRLLAEPSFNSNQNLLRLFRLIENQNSEKLQKPQIWKELFPNRPFSDNQLRKYFSDLNKLGREFISRKHLSENPEWMAFHFIQQVRSPGIAKKEAAKWVSEKTKVGKQGRIDSTSHYIKHKLHQILYSHDIRERKTSSHLKFSMLHLEAFFWVENLKGMCEYYSLKGILSDASEPRIAEKISNFSMDDPELKAFPLVNIYFELFSFLSGKKTATQSSLRKLLDLIHRIESELGDTETRVILNHLQNLYLRMISNMEAPFLEDLDNVYRLRIRKGILLSNEMIAPEDYKNRITLLLKLKKMEEAETFLNEYGKKLSPELRQSAYFFSEGNIHFHRSEFSKMRKSLQKVQDSDPFYFLDIKFLLLKASFLEMDLSAIPYYLDSLTKYISRNKKLSAIRKKPFKERILLFSKLHRIISKNKPAKSKLRDLKNKIDKTENYSDRDFFNRFFQQSLNSR